MPKTLQYSDSPNVETAFAVDSETGKKNRVVLIAAQDTSTLELPDNPNSTKGYVTINGKKHRVILTADLLGEGGGGGTIDTSKVVNADVLPVASADNAGKVYLYKGATDANYTHGYIYECTKESTYTDSVTFQPATLSGTVMTATAGALAGLCAEYITGDITTITGGTMTFDSSSDLWVFVGKDADDNTVGSFQVYQEDYQDAGFTFTGTPQDGDVVAFTCTITEVSSSYAWTRVDVQPTPVTSVNGKTGAVVLSPSDVGAATAAQGAKADTAIQSVKTINNQSIVGTGNVDLEQIQVSALPTASADELGKIYQYIGATDSTYTNGYFYKCVSDGQSPATYSWEAVEVQASSGGIPDQTGNAGKFLTTDGTDASWGNALQNIATGTKSLSILGSTNPAALSTQYSVSLGGGTSCFSNYAISVGGNASVGLSSSYGIAIGSGATANAQHAIQLGSLGIPYAINSDANTFKVANANGNFKLMSADGTIPADRFDSTSGLADGNYRLRLTIADGVPTLSWVAE